MKKYKVTNIWSVDEKKAACIVTQLEIISKDGKTHFISLEGWRKEKNEEQKLESWEWTYTDDKEKHLGGLLERFSPTAPEKKLENLLDELWKGGIETSKTIELNRGIEDLKDFIDTLVYKFPLGDCTNGGASAKYDRIAVCKREVTPLDVREYCEETGDDPTRFFKVEERNILGEIYRNLQPVIRTGWTMAGGNIADTSDGRFREFTGSDYPLAIHDRYEH